MLNSYEQKFFFKIQYFKTFLFLPCFVSFQHFKYFFLERFFYICGSVGLKKQHIRLH